MKIENKLIPKNIQQIMLYVFIAIEAILFILIHFIKSVPSYIPSYIAIIICFLMSFVFFEKSKNWLLVAIALLFTLIADTYLVLLHASNQIAAMIAFNFTQLAYAFKIAIESKKLQNILSLSIRTFLILLIELIAFVFLKIKFDTLIFVTLIYFVNLVCNMAFSFTVKKINLLFSIGLILFICCDVFVGLPFLADVLTIEEGSFIYTLINSKINFIWVFYLPSQTLIVSSLYYHSFILNKQIEK